MRYQTWDVLIFPDQSQIPIQEFKTTCQVVQDPETHSFQTSPHLLPTVTCFIPGLSPGTAFRVSIHCWQNPEATRYLQGFKKPSDNVLFEARLFIDGRIVGSKWFNDAGPWPTVLDLSIDLNKHGEFERLKFPNFHKELLAQSYWNASDDLGRIKLIISEGFARDNLSYPYDRIKNIASFSFQHAPLEVLEASSIAWPNTNMWRQVYLVGPKLEQQESPRRAEPVEVHSHSPRRGSVMQRGQPTLGPGSIQPPPKNFSRPPVFDPFTDPVHAAFHGWRQSSSFDISMPDCASGSSRGSGDGSRQVTDPMSISAIEGGHFESLVSDCQLESLCDAMMPSVPTNTPHNEVDSLMAASITVLHEVSNGTPSPTTEVEEPKKKEPVSAVIESPPVSSNIKSRKENLHSSPLVVRPASAGKEEAIRKISQAFTTTNNGGTKRQRIVTPASSKAIDDEDEPRSSPSTRKLSRASAKGDGQGVRRVLSTLINVGESNELN